MRLLNSDLGMTNRSRLTAALSVPAIRLQTLVRSRTAALLAILSINILGISAPIAALAVHDTGMFELDGNIVHDSATTPPYDWASLFGPTGNQLITPDPNNGPLLASVFVKDFATPDPTYFGSNKDTQPINTGVPQEWSCVSLNNPLAKDDLQNAYAALVQIPANAPDNAGHTVLYVGSERASNNGDSFAGFWLFKDRNVGCNSPGNFTGQHTDGDVLIVSNYTNGGGAQNVDVYKWAGGPSGGPVLDVTLNGGICGGPAHDLSCAIANPVMITSPWPPTSHESNTFVEAGVDLTALFPTGGSCFTTFLAESRSSQEITATLKDYAGGQFNTCPAPPIVTTAQGGSSVAPGTAERDLASVTAVGGRPTPTGTITFSLCSPSEVTVAGCPQGTGTQVGVPVPMSGGSATSTPDVTGLTTPNDLTLGKYCWGASYTPDVASSGTYLSSFHTNATTECFTVVGATTTTTLSSKTGNQLPGVSVTDTATVALNAPAIGGSPTGSVQFALCIPPNGTCSNYGAPVPLDNTGHATSAAVSGTTTPNTLATGDYCWQATYAPTGNFSGSSELSKPGTECFSVGKQPTTTTTLVLSQTVDVRSNTATVGDTSSTPVFVPAGVSFTPGTVTFNLYGPSATANCSTTPKYTSAAIPGTYTSGNATAPATGNVTASTGQVSLANAHITASGTYWWVASYAGDAYNNGSSSACGDEPINAVDAKITITPNTAVNEVGSPHTFTITLTAIPAGTTPSNFSITPTLSSAANLTVNSNTCGTLTVVDANTRQCTYTINASTAGTYTLNASGSVTMGGLVVTRSTSGDSGPGGSGAATKHYVDALITITPHTATNEVGSAHTFTITYTAIPDDAGAPSAFSITPTLNPTTGLTENTNTCGVLTVIDANTRQCTYTINSNTAGTYTLNASGSSTIGGVTVTRSTTGNFGPGGTTGATKHYVDASISITPNTAINAVGNAHTFTITLTAIPDGAGSPSGFSVTPTLDRTNGLTQNTNTCATPNVSGNVATCTYTINSDTFGTYTLNASGSVTMGGVTVTRSTSGNSGPGGSGPATKHYVTATLTITPTTATNEVGHAHTFTLTLTASPDDAGTPSNFIITPSINSTTNLTQNTTTCATPNVSGNVATCTYTINANTAGSYILNATGEVTIGSETIHLTTVGGTGINGPATKHYVDASISITPNQATNVIFHAHTFSIMLTAIPDDAGAPSAFVITPSLSPTTHLIANANTCATPTVNGNVATCTYTINSDTTGTYTLNATGSVTMGGVTVTRSTSGNSGPGGSGPATKNYIAPNSTLVKAERDVTTPDTSQNGGGFTAGPITANPLDVLEYRLTYTNSGKGAASLVTVTDVVEVLHAAYVANSCTGGVSCTYDAASHTITWDLGTVNGGGTQVVLTFQTKLTNDFPVGETTQISNAAVVTTFEEGSKPSNTVVANVFVPVQQVLAAVSLPKAGAGPQPLGNPANGGGGALGGGIVATLLLMLIGSLLFAVRRQSAEAEEPGT